MNYCPQNLKTAFFKYFALKVITQLNNIDFLLLTYTEMYFKTVENLYKYILAYTFQFILIYSFFIKIIDF